jgi:hypothetical protein
VWLALLVALPGLRWLAMSSPAPYRRLLPPAWFEGEALGLTRLGLNAAWCALFLAALPLVLVGLGLRRDRDRDSLAATLGREAALGAPRWPRRGQGAIAIVATAGAISAGVAAAAWLPELRAAYPIYRGAARGVGDWGLSAALTLGVLASTELFYRGLALSVLRRGFGRAAIYLVAALYALDHVGAPMLECAASLAGGVALGHLAAATGSLWPGLGYHFLFAQAVDVTSLWVG